MNVIIAHPMDAHSRGQGGAVRALMNIAQVLNDQGHVITILGMGTERARETFFQQKSICHKKGWVRYLAALYLRLPFLSLQSADVIITHRLDVMLAFTIYKKYIAKIFISAAPMHHLKSILPATLFQAARIPYRMSESYTLCRVDILVPTDSRTESYYRSNHSRLPKVKVLPTAVDHALFREMDRSYARSQLGLTSEGLIVLFVGRLAPVKNVDLLLDAFDRLRARRSDVRLVILGKGEDEMRLRNRAGGIPSITFVGEVASDMVPLWMNASDVLALTSREEGSPTVVKEALACGLPVVSTDVGDVREVVHGTPSLVVLGEPEGFSRALERVLDTGQSNRNEVRTLCSDKGLRYGLETFGQSVNTICSEAVQVSMSRRACRILGGARGRR